MAEHAGVNERTVYRHFATERELRDAVLERLREEAGVELDGLRLEDLARVTRRILEFVSSFPIEPRTSTDPTVAAENARQRAVLLDAVRRVARDWPGRDQQIAAGMFDVLWSPMSYERLVAGGGLKPKDAIRGITWVMALMEKAIGEGSRP